MGVYNFNKRKCIRALKKIGFYQKEMKGKKHDKFFPPSEITINLTAEQPHFIMIPRGNKFIVQEAIIHELKAMGGEELKDNFLINL